MQGGAGEGPPRPCLRFEVLSEVDAWRENRLVHGPIRVQVPPVRWTRTHGASPFTGGAYSSGIIVPLAFDSLAA